MNRENKGSILRQGLNTCESGNNEKTQQLTGGEEGKPTKATIEMERGNGAQKLKGKKKGESEVNGGGLTRLEENKKEGGGVRDSVGKEGLGGVSGPTEIVGALRDTWKRLGKQRAAPSSREELWKGIYGRKDLRTPRELEGSDGYRGHAEVTEGNGRNRIRTNSSAVGTAEDMGWGTPLFDRQPDLGSRNSDVLKERYEGRTLYSIGSGSETGKFWLWRMASEGRIMSLEEIGAPKLGDHEKAEGLLKSLGKEGRLNILRDISKGTGATLRVTGGSKTKHINTGAIDGETLDLNEKTGVLRIGLKRDRVEAHKIGGVNKIEAETLETEPTLAVHATGGR